ncbi:glycoside hydrolase family 6 protein [Gynuella sp.]|uniref:glycoside hydrolase family 6 protein n=1 Tax=Gynuella sp. TaxID=2969146 RepID=UPI003D127B21
MTNRRCNFAIASILTIGAIYGTAAQAATCEYLVNSEWNTGFTAIIKIKNDGNSAIDGWQVGWEYTDGSQVTSGWNANVTGTNPYTATNLGWNGNISVGQSAEFGLQGTKGSTGAAAQIPTVTGSVCGGGGTPTNQAPVAAAQATPTTGNAPLAVSFSASGSTDADGDTLTYSWSFGDGTTGTGVTAAHTYSAAGDYTATVTVSDGSLTDTASVNITVTTESGNTPPNAVISSDVRGGKAPVVVAFDASDSTDADNDPLTYSWVFGDGSTGTGPNPSHLFSDPGSYVVTVTVSDGQDSDQASTTITVTDGSSGAARVDNPFRDAVWYVNPEWSAKAAAEPGGAAIADINTAVWMDRIGAIEGTSTLMGLRDHLNEALVQGANLFMFVVYDLPNRDCKALASNGELLISEGGMARYKAEYIDPIAEILADPAYKDIRIVAIVEIDSLPNLVTNLSVPACQEANGVGGYREGITYALNALSPLDNVYAYVDAAHSGWLGWDSNFGPAVDLISEVITGTDEGWDSIAGFISNTANYTPTVEPYLPDPTLNVGGQPVRSAKFYQWNSYFDEKSYVQEFRRKMIAKGAPSTIGMLIDTSRNGWGGVKRPDSADSSSDLNTYVDNTKVDQRHHRGHWCNQPGGIGYKPWADPYTGVDAFVWVKPPGESDGVADPNFEPDPDDPAKQHDPNCNPDGQSTEDSSFGTDALPGAPHAGRWFPEGFRVLLENAYPPVDEPAGPPAQ